MWEFFDWVHTALNHNRNALQKISLQKNKSSSSWQMFKNWITENLPTNRLQNGYQPKSVFSYPNKIARSQN